jgi:3-dehydroquinate synthase
VPTPDGQYPVFVGAGLLEKAGAILRQLDNSLSSRCALVTNPIVRRLHAPRVIESLRTAGFDPCVAEIPDGEQFKTLDTVSGVYDQLIDAQLDRRSAIVALGGGVVGDLTGFVAATYLRGVPFVQLPTTLLAMVDASVGGKVAVDHPRGKNLIGAFKQPLAVLADADTLATLPDEEWRCGMAEAVKHGVIGDRGLFEELEIGCPKGRKLDAQRAGNWLERAIRVKVDFVSRDPFEQNERAKLNLGHTFGHALERLSNFDLRHGDAVAIGMICAAYLALRLGLCDAQLTLRIENLLKTIGLPRRVPGTMSTDAIMSAMMTDKKRVDGRLRFILPRALGDVVIVNDVAREQVLGAVEDNR